MKELNTIEKKVKSGIEKAIVKKKEEKDS